MWKYLDLYEKDDVGSMTDGLVYEIGGGSPLLQVSV
jgi:hypothetical protein